jgi:hypothetical protein
MKSPDRPTEDTPERSALCVKRDPSALEQVLRDAEITIQGYFYSVDLGSGVYPRHHPVGLDGLCTCYLGVLCPAVNAVLLYLSAGGQALPNPPRGFTRCSLPAARSAVRRSLLTALWAARSAAQAGAVRLVDPPTTGSV